MQGLRDLFDDFGGFLDRHPYLEAMVILSIFYVLAKVVDWLVSGIFSRLVRRSDTDFDDKLMEILHRPLKMTIVMIGLITAAYRIDIERDIEGPVVLAASTVLIIFWMLFARRFAQLSLSAMRDHSERWKYVHPATEPLLSNAAAVVFFLIAAYAILLVWDINITGLVASAGIIGLALSFAAQDTLGNLFAGVAILSDRPYQIGDYIILDSGERGEVVRIGLRSTSLLTRDDVEVSIPNGIMGKSKIVNEAGGPIDRFRIRTGVSVAYGSDIDRVVDMLMDVACRHPGILDSPVPRVRFRTFGESGLEYELLCWIPRPADRGRTIHELNSAIYRRFDIEGIKIPPPQREIYINESSALTATQQLRPSDHE